MSRGDRSLRRLHPRDGAMVNIMLAAALVALVVGVFAPMLTVEKFFVFSNTLSLMSALVQLLHEGQWLLVLVLGAFSVVLPLAKLMLLFWIWNLEPAADQRHLRHLELLAHYGKWSMLDVFVVAVMVVTIKLGAIARVEIHYGVFAFAGSVLITMLATHRITSRYRIGV